MKILLFSGGIESTCLAIAWKPDLCLTIDYGQISAPGEIAASRLIAKSLQLDHEISRVNMREFGSGLLSGHSGAAKGAPEFWPFRNQMLITLAAMKFSKIPGLRICIGTVRTDNRHADGTALFLRSLKRLLEIQQNDLTLEFPAARMSTESLIKKSSVKSKILGFTFSCHTGPLACGRCPGCKKNLAIREWAASYYGRKSRASHQIGSGKLTSIARAST